MADYEYERLMNTLVKPKGTKMDSFVKVIGMLVIGFITLAGIAALLAFPTKWCWNASVAPIFHLQEIDVLQAFCLTWIGNMFFKSVHSNTTKGT